MRAKFFPSRNILASNRLLRATTLVDKLATVALPVLPYHLVHAPAIGLSAIRPSPTASSSVFAPWLFLGGVILFSGSLYVMALTGRRKLGAITPLGGLFFLAGWIAIAYNAFIAG